MLKRRMVVGVVAACCCVAPVLAQTSTAPAGNPPARVTRDQIAPTPGTSSNALAVQVPSNVLRGSKLVGVKVIGADNERIGDIDEILIDGSGRIAAVVVGVGGFLGMGERRVAVPFEAFLWNYGEAARTFSPSASATSSDASRNAPSASAAADRMPGAQVSNEVLNAPDQNRSATVDPATGPALSGSAGGTSATAPVAGSGGPVSAIVRLSKAEIQNAPEFSYERSARANPAGSPGAGAPNAPK